MKSAAFALLGALVSASVLLVGTANASQPAVTPPTAASALSTIASTVSSAITALAGGNCGSTAEVFSPWGDLRDYYLTADGGFENGGAGWSFQNAKVVSGNEPFFVHGKSDHSSLLLSGGGSALSPSLCFGLLYPGIRFMAMSPTGTGTVDVHVIARGALGVLSTLDVGSYSVGKAWAPTTIFNTTFSQLDVPVGTKSIQIELDATGSVQVDDLYIDPFIQR